MITKQKLYKISSLTYLSFVLNMRHAVWEKQIYVSIYRKWPLLCVVRIKKGENKNHVLKLFFVAFNMKSVMQ